MLGFHRPGRWDLIDDVSERHPRLRARRRGARGRQGLVPRGGPRRPGTAADQTGLLRNLVVREGRRTGQLQARARHEPRATSAPTSSPPPRPPDSFLWTRAEGVAETTRGGETKVAQGARRTSRRSSSGLRFRISPDAFFQTNTEMAERLYGAAAELAGAHRPRARARPVLRHRHDRARAGARRGRGLGRRARGGGGGRRDRERAS